VSALHCTTAGPLLSFAAIHTKHNQLRQTPADFMSHCRVKVKCAIPHEECRQDAHLPSLNHKPLKFVTYGQCHIVHHQLVKRQVTNLVRQSLNSELNDQLLLNEINSDDLIFLLYLYFNDICSMNKDPSSVNNNLPTFMCKVI